jgi:hypothetical protein
MARGKNYTDGVFDMNKQALNTASLVVDLLLTDQLITESEDDRAVEIAAKTFLAFRSQTARLSNAATTDIEEESGLLAQQMISVLVEAGIIQEKDKLHAFELAAEEVLVQRSLENI